MSEAHSPPLWGKGEGICQMLTHPGCRVSGAQLRVGGRPHVRHVVALQPRTQECTHKDRDPEAHMPSMAMPPTIPDTYTRTTWLPLTDSLLWGCA